MTKNESDVITFTCIFTGLPAPTVEWTRLTAGSEVPTPLSLMLISSSQNHSTGLYVTNSTLLIPNTDGGLKKTDEGQYNCMGINAATNLIRAVNKSSAFLTVQGERYDKHTTLLYYTCFYSFPMCGGIMPFRGTSDHYTQ